ncbi:hypothetical protein PTKIN_Ptkin18bG0085000 [Pterospermum kingtungense]
MKAYTLALTVLMLLLSVLLSSTWGNKAQAEARPVRHGHGHSSSVSRKGSSGSFQALGDLQTERKMPQKQVDSSFRRIPPSTANPIQNKSNPKLQGERSGRQQIPRSLKH